MEEGVRYHKIDRCIEFFPFMNHIFSTKQPVVSVIIPTFNCATTVSVALESVLSQDFVDKEIIIIDGGSTDGTLKVLKRYENKIAKMISEPDRGIYDALNKGIDLAAGEWVYFLGSDDRLYDSKVFSDIPFRKAKSKMLYGNVVLENDGIIGPSGKIYDGPFSKYKLAKKNICHQAIFYSRDVFVELGKFDERYHMWADWAFNMKAFASKVINPFFFERNIAIYSNRGSSNTVKDVEFLHNRHAIVKKLLGIRIYYLLLLSESKTVRYINRLFHRSS